MKPSAETRPDSLTGSLDGKRLMGLLWVHPRASFVPLDREPIVLGRDETCSVTLRSGRVSRLHARIEPSGPVWVVSDGGSKNGTRHNGRPVDRAPLADNDVLRLGDHVAVVMSVESEDFDPSNPFDEPSPGVLVGPRSRASFERLLQLAPSRLPVVLEGPTGTGKEVYARALHACSQRSGEFVAINCAAIPEALAEAQLFGQARGAFTGASQSTQGVLEASHRGTLLLDEIVDLPKLVQAKLLRALEDSQVTRVGETKPRTLDLRIVAATQEPLSRLVERAGFRGDLLARLAGGTVRLLPLRKRREEILALFRRFLAQAGRASQPLSAGFVEALCLRDWPLNTRQVAQVAAQAVLTLPPTTTLRSTELDKLLERVYGESLQKSEPGPGRGATEADATGSELAGQYVQPLTALGTRRAAWFERHRSELTALLNELERNRGNVSQAAKSIGISRQQAHRLLSAHAALTGRSPADC